MGSTHWQLKNHAYIWALMSSIAKHIYPQIVWRNRVKKLWNPIQKKALENRPEERVRLRVMEALVRAGWSKHRISTEEAIGGLGNSSMRTDIICYTRQFEPWLLTECKAEYISISSKTAEQVARYNQKVGAPYLLMTNGIADYWYAIENDGRKVKELENQPDILEHNPDRPEFTFDDWRTHGFAGGKASPYLRRWLSDILPKLWLSEGKASIRFLNFSDGPSDVDLNHYYRIAPVSETRRLALTVLNTAYGGNRMVVILNQEGENKAVLEINLDLLFAEKKGNSSIYSREGLHTFDLAQHFDLTTILTVDNLLEQLNQLFGKHAD